MVRYVDCQIYQQKDYGHIQYKPLYYGVIPLGYPHDNKLADARPTEDRLYDDGATKQIPCAGSKYRNHRQKSIFKAVVPHYRTLGQSLRPGGAHVVLASHFQHTGPGKSRQFGQCTE